MSVLKNSLILITLVFLKPLWAQDIDLYQQFNGRYDYVAIGNTLNLFENGAFGNCVISTSSSADLTLNANQTITAAYLYWAGSDTGDFDISLNGIPISAERTFSDALDATRVFFAAFADVTTIIQNQGNTTYTISDFDLSGVIDPYCPTGTNFGGWAITIIYEDSSLPLNQLNVYDGLQSVPTNLSVTLENLNVLDTQGAKIGFIAWEGDAALAVNEQLSINGNPISNPPLNPINNAFNGTNSFTGQSNLYNMDIDVYNIQNNINIGDTTANITLTSGQDFVMINNIITVLNSQLPDATITLDTYTINCGDRTITVEYTVFNNNSTNPLPANTPIAFYAEGQLVGQSMTTNEIPINASESGIIQLLLPDNIETMFLLSLVVDDDGTGNGIIAELNETNNLTDTLLELLVVPPIENLPNEIACNEGFSSATFNLTALFQSSIETEFEVLFFESLADLEANTNSIINPENYINTNQPQPIYAKVELPPCYEIYQFELAVENCPPVVPQGFSPNGDHVNDWFNIQGLYDIFEQHELKIYNRYGTLIFEGDNNHKWYGLINRGLNNHGKLVPVGTYFYILNPNDTQYQPQIGWVYVNY